MNKIAPDKYIIGITGTIGSGKSQVSRYMADCFKTPLIDLDQICKNLLQPSNIGYLMFKQEFGTCFVDPEGFIDRILLRKIIFSDPTMREKLNKIMHPLAFQVMKDTIHSNNAPFFLVEIPLLFEAGWQRFLDKTVLVYADESTCFKRITRRDKVSAEQACKALQSQMPMKKKILLADHVINNNASWARAILEITQLKYVVAQQSFLLNKL